MDDDDDYGSDEFDSLPAGTLYELEQNAFQATQASQAVNNPLRTQPLNNAGALRPPPRLHTGLSNDYNRLEVGELEAEVYENVEGQHVIPHGNAPDGQRWAGHGQSVDAMEVDDYYGQGSTADINARLIQVGARSWEFALDEANEILKDGTRTSTDDARARRGEESGGNKNRGNFHYSKETSGNDTEL
jgi:hypothetical protein